jgi:DNA-binding XRE family transcriptional regulator
MAKAKAVVAGTLTVQGVEYVVIPKAEYLRMQDLAPPSGAVDAREFTRGSIAAGLRAAREHAKLTQSELAERMGKSQTMVSQAESGTARVSERYVRAVLEACGLPEDWGGKTAARGDTKRSGRRAPADAAVPAKPRKRARRVA